MTGKEIGWRGHRCLVTGGLGFGGSHLCEQLLLRKARVHVLDNQAPRDSYLRLLGLADRVAITEGDIRDATTVNLTIARFEIETVFHLAAQPIVPVSNELPFETFEANATGTYVLLEAVRRQPRVRRFIFASSGAYYGTNHDDRPLPETQAPAALTNVYAASKVAADVAVQCYANAYGVPAVACRFMNTYGPGDTNFSRLVPRAVRNLLRDEPYDFGERDDGTTRLDFLHVRDMASAYIRAAERCGQTAHTVYNFGTGRAIATAEVASLVSELFDGKRRAPGFRGEPRGTPIVKYLDVSRARTELGWEAATSLRDGLRETVEWYRSNWAML